MHVSGRSITTIGRLTVTGGSSDVLVARLRLESMLASVGLRPPSLSPSAVLCVRHLSDPLPHRLRAGRGAQPQKWAAAARGRLDELVRRATYPACEFVPANANAVLFADHAELLACLTRLWLNGEMINHWWWHSLAPLLAGRGDFVAAWLTQPAIVPLALAHLVSSGDGARFARALPVSLIPPILMNVAHTFALPDLAQSFSRLLDPAMSPVFAPPDAESQSRETLHKAVPRPSTESHLLKVPWLRWLPADQQAGLTRLQELLLGIVLTIYHDRPQAQQRTFAASVERWFLQASDVPDSVPSIPSSILPSATIQPDRSPDAPDSLPVMSIQGPIEAAASTSPLTEIKSETLIEADRTVMPKEEIFAVEMASVSLPPIEDLQSAHSENTDTSSFPARLFDTPLPWEMPRVIATEYGGLFYLLNAAIALNLYGDFTMPMHPGLALPVADFLALLGLEWIGDDFIDDPLWGLLARLAGRGAGDSPGHNFNPPCTWRVPPDWLDAFPEQDGWRWNAVRGRLIVWHPMGFSVVDIPRSGPTSRQLSRALHPYGAAAARDRAITLIPAAPLSRWIGWLTAYLQARLKRALGSEDIIGVLFKHPARLYLSSTNIDVVFPLHGISLEARMAGLDRDPGWMPALGRVLTFYFREETES